MSTSGTGTRPHRVSVVIPTCNRTELLRRALASIAALEADDLRFQMIVADNGQCPAAATVAAEFGAVYLKVDRKGASEARNAALELARGDYITFLDDDDAWLPGHIRPHLKMLDQDPTLEGVIGQVIYVDETFTRRGIPWPPQHPGRGKDLVRRMLSGYFPQIGTTVIRTSALDRIGGFDPKLIGGEDLDWLIRMAGRHALGFVETPCILFTQRETGTYDRLQLTRLGFDRRVFHRHALKHWRVWRSPVDYMRAYSGSLIHFYRYFAEAALLRASRGERWNALGAIFTAVRIFPLRAAKHMVTNTTLRQALIIALFASPTSHRIHLPVWLAILHI